MHCAAPAAEKHPVRELITYLIGAGTLEASWEMLRKKDSPNPRQWQVDADGFAWAPNSYQALLGGAHAEFAVTERQYIESFYLRAPGCAYRFEAPGKPGPWQHYRAILRRAYENGQAVDLFVPPVHSRLLLAIDAVGLWSKYEQFLIGLDAVNREEAARNGRTPFKIFDFARVGPVQSEPVPGSEAKAAIMQNYWDTSHFTRKVGDRVLAVMGGAADDEFGAPLGEGANALHLSKLRQDLDDYRRQESGTYEFLRHRVESALSRPACGAVAVTTR